MCSVFCYQCIRRPLSDENAAKILDFLQEFTNNFENQYGNQIHRYYTKRARHNTHQNNPARNKNDPPF